MIHSEALRRGTNVAAFRLIVGARLPAIAVWQVTVMLLTRRFLGQARFYRPVCLLNHICPMAQRSRKNTSNPPPMVARRLRLMAAMPIDTIPASK